LHMHTQHARLSPGAEKEVPRPARTILKQKKKNLSFGLSLDIPEPVTRSKISWFPTPECEVILKSDSGFSRIDLKAHEILSPPPAESPAKNDSTCPVLFLFSDESSWDSLFSEMIVSCNGAQWSLGRDRIVESADDTGAAGLLAVRPCDLAFLMTLTFSQVPTNSTAENSNCPVLVHCATKQTDGCQLVMLRCLIFRFQSTVARGLGTVEYMNGLTKERAHCLPQGRLRHGGKVSSLPDWLQAIRRIRPNVSEALAHASPNCTPRPPCAQKTDSVSREHSVEV